MHYLLVIGVKHNLFTHYDLMEVYHIIKVDSCKHSVNIGTRIHVLHNKICLWYVCVIMVCARATRFFLPC
jgi:hypothetical protein